MDDAEGSWRETPCRLGTPGGLAKLLWSKYLRLECLQSEVRVTLILISILAIKQTHNSQECGGRRNTRILGGRGLRGLFESSWSHRSCGTLWEARVTDPLRAVIQMFPGSPFLDIGLSGSVGFLRTKIRFCVGLGLSHVGKLLPRGQTQPALRFQAPSHCAEEIF